jgi:hypothetical protein
LLILPGYLNCYLQSQQNYWYQLLSCWDRKEIKYAAQANWHRCSRFGGYVHITWHAIRFTWGTLPPALCWHFISLYWAVM